MGIVFLNVRKGNFNKIRSPLINWDSILNLVFFGTNNTGGVNWYTGYRGGKAWLIMFMEWKWCGLFLQPTWSNHDRVFLFKFLSSWSRYDNITHECSSYLYDCHVCNVLFYYCHISKSGCMKSSVQYKRQAGSIVTYYSYIDAYHTWNHWCLVKHIRSEYLYDLAMDRVYVESALLVIPHLLMTFKKIFSHFFAPASNLS